MEAKIPRSELLGPRKANAANIPLTKCGIMPLLIQDLLRVILSHGVAVNSVPRADVGIPVGDAEQEMDLDLADFSIPRKHRERVEAAV